MTITFNVPRGENYVTIFHWKEWPVSLYEHTLQILVSRVSEEDEQVLLDALSYLKNEKQLLK